MLFRYSWKFVKLALALVGFLSLSACSNNLVTIHYQQPANCYVFDKDPGGAPHTTTGAGQGMFVIYKITSIDNKDTNAADWTFNLAKVYVNTLAESSGNTSLDYLVKTIPNSIFVAKGQTVPVSNGRFIINVAGDPTQLKNAGAPLHYNSAQGESVLMAQEPAILSPKFLDPCTPNNLP